MSSLYALLKQLYDLNCPPDAPEKRPDALRFGILGAARIAPNTLITPAISHAGVVMSAVASRNCVKAEAYAKKHSIAKVYAGTGFTNVRASCMGFHAAVSDGRSIDIALIDNIDIDVVYIALPNGLHFEWTVHALNQGKHILVEKLMADTAAEVRYLVDLAVSKGLVLLEAIHYTFHPSTQRVKEIIDSGELGKITCISGDFGVPVQADSLLFPKDDIRYNYDLGGGSVMDLGVYPLSAIRHFMDSEPVKVSSATAVGHPLDPSRIDRAMIAKLIFPSSVEADLYTDFAMPSWGPLHIIPRAFRVSIRVQLEHGEIEFYNYILPHVFHSISVKPRDGPQRVEKVYSFKGGFGKDWWSTYRYQLEAFVDKVRGCTPQTWPPAEEPVLQMQWVESLYSAAEMPIRPVSAAFSRLA